MTNPERGTEAQRHKGTKRGANAPVVIARSAQRTVAISNRKKGTKAQGYKGTEQGRAVRPETQKLKTVFSDGDLIVRGSGALIEGVAARKARVVADERGRLGEIMRADDPWFEKFGQAYFTTTFPGVVKGWHYHARQTDHIYVARGMLKIVLYDGREKSPTQGVINELYLGEHCPGMVKVPPGVYHGWMCIGCNEAYVVNLPSEMYDYASPDEYRCHPHEGGIPYDWTRKDG